VNLFLYTYQEKLREMALWCFSNLSSYNKGILASIPTYDCEAKFFISYQGNKFQLLQSLFENIEEKFESKGRNYVIGNIKLKKLNDSQLLNQRNYSIIQID